MSSACSRPEAALPRSRYQEAGTDLVGAATSVCAHQTGITSSAMAAAQTASTLREFERPRVVIHRIGPDL